MAYEEEWRDERSLNYRDPEVRHMNALEFIEREKREGGAWWKLVRQARWRIDNDELFKLDYEIENIKRGLVRRGECDASEAKAMFKYASASYATIIRELILAIPELAGYTRIRRCSISQFYPQLEIYEHSAEIDVESGGDVAA